MVIIQGQPLAVFILTSNHDGNGGEQCRQKREFDVLRLQKFHRAGVGGGEGERDRKAKGRMIPETVQQRPMDLKNEGYIFTCYEKQVWLRILSDQ